MLWICAVMFTIVRPEARTSCIIWLHKNIWYTFKDFQTFQLWMTLKTPGSFYDFPNHENVFGSRSFQCSRSLVLQKALGHIWQRPTPFCSFTTLDSYVLDTESVMLRFFCCWFFSFLFFLYQFSSAETKQFYCFFFLSSFFLHFSLSHSDWFCTPSITRSYARCSLYIAASLVLKEVGNDII